MGRQSLRWCAALAVFAWASIVPCLAGGAGELSLDRGAIHAVFEAALAQPRTVELPGAGSIPLRFERSRPPRFTEGGVEVDVPFHAGPLSGNLAARYVPQVDRLDGTVRLVAEQASADVGLPAAVDVAAWMPVVALPRSLRGSLPALGEETQVSLFVQEVRVDDERLVLEFGLALRRPGQPSAGAAARR
ncbi:hypothetical protein ABI59_13080 [Acidobacteria bacterium Mor1]|nr:hypothetical protein ABI59_13080 [Acidobacteria bacterium Mor1]